MTDPRPGLIAELAHAGAHAVAQRLVLASGGNLSARIPGSDAFLVTGTGTWLVELGPGSFAEVGLDGTHRDGPAPSVEWKLHARTYAARPDIAAIVHLHPQHVLLVTALGKPIRRITSDHQFYLGEIATVPFHPAGSEQIAIDAADAAREHDSIVLAHHGCSALGENVRMALRRALNLEEAAAMTYRLLLAGDESADFPEQWKGRIIDA